MRVIKFPLSLGLNTIAADHCVQPRWIEWQDTSFVVWMQEFTQLPPETVDLYLATTGEQVPEHYEYVATATTPDKQFVAHLFKC